VEENCAGQCSKLKCCLNFELDCYVDAQKQFPSRDIPLNLADSSVWFQKMEVHKGIYWYSTEPHSSVNLTAVPVQRVREIQDMNRKGKKPERLLVIEDSFELASASEDLLKNNSLTRFDIQSGQGQPQRQNNKRKNRRFNDRRNK
jgi:hypothetical protein